jgi:hypothetical protein
LKKFYLFILTSGFSFLLNNLLNLYFVEILHADSKLSASITYFLLFFLNFFIFKNFIFIKEKGSDKKLNIYEYIKLNLILRLLEYLSFLTLLKVLNLYFLIIVNLVSIFFTLLKYFYLRRMTLN